MKKWIVILISTVIALCFVALLLSKTVSFSNESIEYSPGLLADLLETTPPPSSPDVFTEQVVPSPSETAAPTPAVSTPAATFTPVPLSTPEMPAEPSPTLEPVDYSALPVITITNETYPEVITTNTVVDLKGTINTDTGVLTDVYAEISQDGKTHQYSQYSPMSPYFSLAGTVNADLRFSNLAVGEYRYLVTASASNEAGNACEILIDVPFFVVSPGSSEDVASSSGSVTSPYVARMAEDTDEASHIWNFLIGQFNNPYAAAGILANMEAESNLSPTASQGDFPSCGYGLCQWTKDRKERLKTFAELAETDIGDIDLQLCYIIYELDNYYPQLKQYLLNAPDGYSAASKFCAIYGQAASYGHRSAFVQKYLDRFAAA